MQCALWVTEATQSDYKYGDEVTQAAAIVHTLDDLHSSTVNAH